ncbi:proto-oncogene Mas-like isoform X1 [Lissotriton helveticus]
MPSPTETPSNWTIWRNNASLETTTAITVLTAICLLFCILGLAGNCMVIFLLGFRIKKNNFTIYILNLAIADFIFLLCAFVLKVHITIYSMQTLNVVKTGNLAPDWEYILNFDIYLLVACLFGYNTSLYILTAISVERCLAVYYPIWYQCHRPKKLSIVICFILWVISCLVTSSEFFICEQSQYVSEHQRFITKYSQSCKVVYVIIDILSFLIFTPFMVLSSAIMLIKIKKDSWKQQSSKLYIVIVATVVLFLIFGMPIRLVLHVQYKYQPGLPLWMGDLCPLLCSINSSINPFIYWLIGRQMGGKESFQMILLRIFREDLKERCQQNPHRSLSRTETAL